MTMYTVRVVGNGAPVNLTCTTSPCLYVQQVYVPATSYTIFVASINGDGAVGPESNATIYGQLYILSLVSASLNFCYFHCMIIYNIIVRPHPDVIMALTHSRS